MYQLRKKRAAPKEHQIAKKLRMQIVDGELKPGTQLPKRLELERVFSVSPVTLQRALQHLIKDGFIYARAGHGTFVVDHPPHLSHYGLVFPSHPNERETWGNFYTALNNVALDIQRAGRRSLAVYYGLERPEHHEAREKLIEDVQAHRLAGLVFAFSPHNFKGTPIVDEPRIKRVAVMKASMPGIPAVSLDGTTLTKYALDFFAARGRKRLAVICTPGQAGLIPHLAALALERGMTTHPYWQHAVTVGAPEWACNIVHLMTQAPRETRPDALIIVDDNLVPHATAGLLAGGISVPTEMDVVAHGNFPWLTPSMVPAKRIGFDARSVLSICLETLDRQRKKVAVENVILVPASVDEEVEQPMM